MRPTIPVRKIQAIPIALALYLALAAGGLGLGETFTLPRATVSIFLLMASVLTINKRSPFGKSEVTILFLFTIFLLTQFFRTTETSIALAKIDGFLIGGIFVLVLSNHALRAYGKDFLITFISVGIIFLVATIIYKFNYGFWDRLVRYFVNGPIVFGWMMSIMALASLFVFFEGRGRRFLAAYVVFALSVVWSGSKGPLIALAISTLYFLIKSRKIGSTFAFLLAAPFSFVSLLEFGLLPERLMVFQRVIEGSYREFDHGSIGIRATMLGEAIDIFLQNPVFGVGIANWSHYSQQTYLSSFGFIYPHNFFGEVLSEFGVVGMIFVVCIFAFIWTNGNVLSKTFAVFAMVALMFTGDISYWRFLVFFPLSMSRIVARGW
ncbi:O-antigen ligase [Maritimibacter sp. HL-12]|uniref:O-antigen ligase family protein n=1 Tax=Maritimibacter sp. HL-12 TaxID=1162418 RepID=UPI00111BE206|nr:O-antigen ligase family protein [Maritimibacter sp. HL-12]